MVRLNRLVQFITTSFGLGLLVSLLAFQWVWLEMRFKVGLIIPIVMACCLILRLIPLTRGYLAKGLTGKVFLLYYFCLGVFLLYRYGWTGSQVIPAAMLRELVNVAGGVLSLYNQFLAIVFWAGLCSYYLRLGISTGLIWLLFTQIELQGLSSLPANITWSYLLVALVLALMAMPYSAYKWQPLLQAQGLQHSLGKLTRFYFLGLFFNNFFPSSIGGDVIRIFQAGKEGRNYEKAAASVLVERGLATFGLVIVGLGAALFSLTSLENILLPVLILSGVGLALVIILLIALGLLPGEGGEKKNLRPWQEKLYQVGAAIKLYRGNGRLLLKVVWLSAGFQLIVVAINYYLFLALGRPVSFWDCALYIPVISVLAMIPFSINGLGVREGAYVYFFAQTGLDGATAIAASLLFFFVVMVASLPGGVYFALVGKSIGYGEVSTFKQA